MLNGQRPLQIRALPMPSTRRYPSDPTSWCYGRDSVNCFIYSNAARATRLLIRMPRSSDELPPKVFAMSGQRDPSHL